jgi:hypothetical protein
MVPRIAIILILGSFAASGQDSLRIVGIPAWRVYRLIHDVKNYHLCLTALDDTQAALDSANQTIGALEGIKINLETQVDQQTEIAHLNWVAYNSEAGLRKIENKVLRRQNLKITLVAVGEAVIIVLLIL